MKKTFTLLLLASATFVSAQSIHIYYHKVDVTGQTIVIPAQKGNDAEADLALTNTTNAAISYTVSRTLQTPLDACAQVYFCTGLQCYGPDDGVTWTAPDTVEIKANQTLPDPNIPNTFGVAAHYGVCENSCSDLKVKYKVYKVNAGTNDTATVTINYSCTAGVEEENAFGSLSNAYPNPATSGFSVDYSMPVFTKSLIEVVDVLGKKVIEFPLQKSTGTAMINTSSLPSGVYFYTLIVGNQRTATKRLIISE